MFLYLKQYFFLLLVTYSQSECMFSNNIYFCKESELKQIEYEFYSKKPQDYETVVIEIIDSQCSIEDTFLESLDQSSKNNIHTIKIINSGVESVNKNAFSDYENLKVLNLDSNKIESISFVQTLPTSINELILRNNSIYQLEDVFTNLKYLKLIDLSHCKLDNVDFSMFKENVNLDIVNVSHNNIHTSVSKQFFKNIKCVDISYNNLTEYSNIPSYCLDFSYTYIPGYRWFNVSEQNETVLLDKFYYIGNDRLHLNATNIHNDFLVIETGHFNMSKFKGNIYQLQLIKVKVVNEFIFKDSIIPILDKSIYDFQHLFYPDSSIAYFDLSNCSIDNIVELYFKNYSLRRLNLCYNNITNLKNNVFSNAHIQELDLCHSGIQTISDDAFDGLAVEKLNLSHNKLNSLHFFSKINSLVELDLSFNQIGVIGVDTFSSLVNLEILDLSNNLLNTLEGDVLVLASIRILNLRNNKLTVIKPLTFHDMPNLNHLLLDGNPISRIESNAFNSLPNLKILYLTGMGINNLESEAFSNLQGLEIIYLDCNNISGLPRNVFLDVPSLKTIYLQQNRINSFAGIQKLNLSSLQISVDDTFLTGNLNMPQLRYLCISDSNFNALKRSHFLGLYNLIELNFIDSNVILVQPGALDGLFNLRYISPHLFSRATILRKYTFRDLKSLEKLDLSGFILEVIEPETFRGLDNLHYLHLNNNRIAILDNYVFSGLDSLIKLDLSQNGVYELYIKTFDGLSNLNYLLLNQNNISVLPLGIFQNLCKLESLNLGSNQITDLTIGIFSGLQNLRILDLSLNNLYNICSGVLFPLVNLDNLNLEGNLLTSLDGVIVFRYSPKLQFIGVNGNNFSCQHLTQILSSFKYINDISIKGTCYDTQNINGITCNGGCGSTRYITV